jgi:hypothetical protein
MLLTAKVRLKVWTFINFEGSGSGVVSLRTDGSRPNGIQGGTKPLLLGPVSGRGGATKGALLPL